MKTIHFILAVVIGWYLADHRELPLLQSAVWRGLTVWSCSFASGSDESPNG